MEDKKYYIKPTSLMSVIYKIESFIPLFVFIGLWFEMKQLNFGINFFNIFLFPIIISLIIPIFFLFFFDKFHYYKLTDTYIIFYRIFPTLPKFDYKKIKSIKISNDSFKNIDYEYYPNKCSKISWLVKLDKMEEFIQDISRRYKAYTGKNLEIIRV